MSTAVMTLVWKHYRRGGSEKLALLALADWCDDQGGTLFPSIATVASKICTSNCQARRIMHAFIDEGLLQVVGNHHGGAPGQSRHYRINLEKLTETPSIHATPRTDATPSMDARDGSHGCARRLAPMLANPSLTIKEPLGTFANLKPATVILEYLNKKASRNYRPVPANISLISARLREGATVDDCKAVIDAKAAEWLREKTMCKFLRPATLFNASKFAQYVGELGDQLGQDGKEDWE